MDFVASSHLHPQTVYPLLIKIYTFVLMQAQYILIHQALLEHNQFGETEITLPELHSTLSTLKEKSSGNEPTLMEDEFDVRHLMINPLFTYLKSEDCRGTEEATVLYVTVT